MRTSTTIPLRPVAGRQHGFSLIELMVGMVVGLLAVLVITQVLTLAEGKKRTVGMGADAQVNGALALFALKRDIEQAGYGAVEQPYALGCTVKYQGSADTGSFKLAPVEITDGGSSAASDSITVLTGNTVNFSAPMFLTSNALQADDHFTVASSFGASVGDMMIAVPMASPTTAAWTTDGSVPCGVFTVTSSGTTAPAGLTSTNVPHASSSGWNHSAVFPSAGVLSGSYLLDMGAMVSRTYSVGTNGLQSTDLSQTDGSKPPAVDLYPQIVMMQALYGKDVHNTGAVNTYDKTTPVSSDDWLTVKSIRIAVVARSNQYEKEAVTTSSPKWDVGSVIGVAGAASCNGSSSCLSLDVSTIVGADWQHYRYKVYDTIVPLRNMLWSNCKTTTSALSSCS
jgi:type IV pilus assembly protein PilW